MKEAIILAGGLGTRLRPVVSDIPKCMAPVAGRPFLHYLLIALESAGFDHIILSLGYKHEVVEEYVLNKEWKMEITSIVETEPLGTGGAVKFALSKSSCENVFILNGDTFLDADYRQMSDFHIQTNAKATLALKEMHNFDRYGSVETDRKSRIVRFIEKQYCRKSLINAGVYILRKNALSGFPEKFSLEKDFFEQTVAEGSLSGFLVEGYFIDIGIPDDYSRAQIDFADGKYQTV
ncbi:MAG: nucleotidyltransferase family protein [Dysgonamonadaceae bacterium]|jgi:D-glycero-alpha-D-manno-heptose 1-phosphate guanylyltransferase|nr:nucleotidyltransferase family protein [Dysgonamonadaceae bacterium]